MCRRTNFENQSTFSKDTDKSCRRPTLWPIVDGRKLTFDGYLELGRSFSDGVGGSDCDFAGKAASQRLQRESRLSRLGRGLDDNRRRCGQLLVVQTPVHRGRRDAGHLHRDDLGGARLQLLSALEFVVVVDRRRRYSDISEKRFFDSGSTRAGFSWWEAWGPGPPAPPLNPALGSTMFICRTVARCFR